MTDEHLVFRIPFFHRAGDTGAAMAIRCLFFTALCGIGAAVVLGALHASPYHLFWIIPLAFCLAEVLFSRVARGRVGPEWRRRGWTCLFTTLVSLCIAGPLLIVVFVYPTGTFTTANLFRLAVVLCIAAVASAIMAVRAFKKAKRFKAVQSSPPAAFENVAQ